MNKKLDPQPAPFRNAMAPACRGWKSIFPLDEADTKQRLPTQPASAVGDDKSEHVHGRSK